MACVMRGHAAGKPRDTAQPRGAKCQTAWHSCALQRCKALAKALALTVRHVVAGIGAGAVVVLGASGGPAAWDLGDAREAGGAGGARPADLSTAGFVS